MKIIKAGVTQPKGFLANSIYCGIKRSGRPDLSLIYSKFPCTAAGVYTQNSVKAAPLIISKSHLKDGTARAVICNSGNANCFTGSFGLIYAKRMAEITAKLLKIKTSDVIVASTGIIGQPLPFAKIAEKAPLLVHSLGSRRINGTAAALGIMTTDLMTKEIAVSVELDGATVTIGGCAKGSGMIEPNMATMLGFLTTDAAIDSVMLKKALKIATDLSFNRITVDGCMSTNDMVTIMANGSAGNALITKEDKNFKLFCEALIVVCLDLAKKIVLDGEGASKFIEVHISGAPNERTALKAAKAVANSNLVKTADYDQPNPNWGRIAAAIGSLGIKIDEETLKISVKNQKNIVRLEADLHMGKAEATVYSCNLTEEYIRINGKYN